MTVHPSIPLGAGHKKEVEVKLRVSPERVEGMKRLLRRMGAQKLGRVHEMNTLYDTPRGRFRKRGHLLRLRVTTPAGARGETAGLLTYKGPSLRLRDARPRRVGASADRGHPSTTRRASRYKVREEIEAQIHKPEQLRAILHAVGLVPAFRYEKFRTSYCLRRAPGVAVELDETPVGTFLELEGSPRAIDRVAKLLGYGPADYINRSYLALYLEACRPSRTKPRERQGSRPRDMLFR